MAISTRIRTSAARVGAAAAFAVRNYPWVVLTVGVSLTFLLVAAVVSAAIDIPIRDPEGSIIGKRMMLPFVFMALFIIIDCVLRVARGKVDAEPGVSFPRRIAHVLADRWWWQRSVLAIVGFMSFSIAYLAYRNLKSWVSLIDYYTWDKELGRIDRVLSFGHPPATVLHNALGTGISAHVLSTIYLAFIPFVPISVAAALAFSNRIRDGYVYVAATSYCWILGTLSYYMLPSLGPFSSFHWQFATLPPTGVKRVQDALIEHHLYLHSDPLGYNNVGSIGAFASLHVGVVFMAFLVAMHFKQRVLAIIVGCALIPTALATVYFGWHYLADDIAGLFIGWFAYVSALWTIYPKLGWLPARWRHAFGDHRGAELPGVTHR